jgi:MFS family permease
MQRLRERLRESLGAMREVFRNRYLRRLQLAWAGSIIGSWANSVALVVYAYQHGGASSVGLLGLIKWLPAAFASPLTGALGDRYPRVPVMLGADLLRAAGVGGIAACIALHGPVAVVFALAAFVAVTATTFQPAQAALLPALARTPEELTAANVSSGSLESLGFVCGPALGGVLLAVSSTSVVFTVTAGAFLWSALMVSRLRSATEPPLDKDARPTFLHDSAEGFRTIWRDRRLRVVVGLFSAQTFVNGAVQVLLAVTALRLLDLGSGGVGYLNSAMGVGGLVGAVVSLALVAHRRLASTFGLAVAGTGAPIIFIAAHESTPIALLAFGLIGLSNLIEDVSGFTVLQRTAPGEVLGRVFGVLHSLLFATTAFGAILAPRLIDLIGARWSLVTVGAILPVIFVVTRLELSALDDHAVNRERQVALLRAIPIFAPLGEPVLEGLAARLVPLREPAGTEIVRKGEAGNRFYLVADGEIEVVLDSGPPRREGAGAYFGEIALLRDVPRTATVRAATDVELYALERDDFVTAVTGHAGSAQAAEAVVGARLGIAAV